MFESKTDTWDWIGLLTEAIQRWQDFFFFNKAMLNVILQNYK